MEAGDQGAKHILVSGEGLHSGSQIAILLYLHKAESVPLLESLLLIQGH